MGFNETYLLHAAILSIHSQDGNRTPIMVPSGATIVTTEGPLDGLRMIDVRWEDKTVMIFTIDVQERATLVPAEKSGNSFQRGFRTLPIVLRTISQS